MALINGESGDFLLNLIFKISSEENGVIQRVLFGGILVVTMIKLTRIVSEWESALNKQTAQCCVLPPHKDNNCYNNQRINPAASPQHQRHTRRFSD